MLISVFDVIKNMRIYIVIIFVFMSLVRQLEAKTFVVAEYGHPFLQFLDSNKVVYQLCNKEEEVLGRAQRNDGVLFIRSGGVVSPTQISSSFLKKANQLGLKIYLEYPYYIGKMQPDVKDIKLERGVVLDSDIKGLVPYSIFTLNDHSFYTYPVQKSLAVIGKVAGFERAEYGVDDIEHYPLLFRKDGNMLVSSVSLSDFGRSRFGPYEVLNGVWLHILKFCQADVSELKSLASHFSPSFREDYVPQLNDYENAINKGAAWYYKSKLLVHPEWEHLVEQYTKKNGEGVVYPIAEEQQKIGDGSLGILEGHASYIHKDGSQPIRWWIRGDCQAETAYALSSAAAFGNNVHYSKTAKNLLDYLYKTSNLRAGERNDPKSTSYGLIGWATTDPDAYYGDDNARTLLATIGASANLNAEDYYSYIIEGILGNFRTAGAKGFRGPWYRDSKLQKLKWEEIFDKEIVNVHPHYECWLWANYLWLYDKTGYQPLLERAKTAIAITMEAFPQWKWTNGIQQEYARMLLPLAWLVRVEDTPLHRYWLNMMANVLLQDLDDCGAIKEKLGIAGLGRYEKVKSNQEYGEKEAPLISDYGDRVTDLLYTLNYASFGLQEAFAATQDNLYGDALKKINDFFVKVQVKSTIHSDLNGAWVRAFDFGRWDYWASNADSGWGPWGTQTGWTQSWIINSLVSGVSKSNFWDKTNYFKNNAQFQNLFNQRKQMMLKKTN